MAEHVKMHHFFVGLKYQSGRKRFHTVGEKGLPATASCSAAGLETLKERVVNFLKLNLKELYIKFDIGNCIESANFPNPRVGRIRKLSIPNTSRLKQNSLSQSVSFFL